MSLIKVKSMQMSIDVIQTSLAAIHKFLGLVGSESNEVNLESKYPRETAIIKDRISTLQKAWEQLAKKFSVKNHDILNQNNIKKFWYDITQFEIWLTKIKIGILSEEDPRSLLESEALLSKQDSVSYEIKKFKNEYNRVLTVGERLTAAALISEDPEYYILKQRIQELRRNWAEITSLCKNRKDHLIKNMKSFGSICVSVQTDPDQTTVAPSSMNSSTHANDTPKESSAQLIETISTAVQNCISSTSTKMEEVISHNDMNSPVDSSKTNNSSGKRGIFSGKYSVPVKNRRDSRTSLKKPEGSKSLLTELRPQKSNTSEEKVCKFIYNKDFSLKRKDTQDGISKNSEHEFDIGKCLNADNYFGDKNKPSKLPF